jgi:hypothetical protein
MFNYAQAEFEVNPKTLMTCPQFLKTVEEFPNSAYNHVSYMLGPRVKFNFSKSNSSYSPEQW